LKYAPIALIMLLGACNAETNFQNTNQGGEQHEGQGGLEWFPEAVEISGLQQGITGSATLQLNSVGENNLLIYEVRVLDSGGGVFYMGDDDAYEDRELAPGTSLEIPVTATMDEWAEVVEGTLRVKTNDPDAISLEIPAYAYPATDWAGGGDDTGGDDDTGS
jgi:hypothetical protein